jgi:hypothetical protein
MPKHSCYRCSIELSTGGIVQEDGILLCSECDLALNNWEREHPRTFKSHRSSDEQDRLDGNWILKEWLDRRMERCPACAKKKWCIICKSGRIICSACTKEDYHTATEKYSIYCYLRIINGPPQKAEVEFVRSRNLTLLPGCTHFEAEEIIRQYRVDNWRTEPLTLAQLAFLHRLGVVPPPRCTGGQAHELINKHCKTDGTRRERERYYEILSELEEKFKRCDKYEFGPMGGGPTISIGI